LERNYTDPFKSKLLAWLGSWRASIAVGEAEGDGVAVTNVRFMAARINIKPRPWLEFGVSRTAQWCGSGRPCGWQVFKEMLLGQDNTSGTGDRSDEPGNQMAGYDLRMRSPWRKLPMALYAQMIGEDEAGSLPSKFLGLFGLETWGSIGGGAWRVRLEYADTTCSFSRTEPQFDCAYRNSLYPQGYAYRGRIVGHSLDNDSQMFTVGGIFTASDGNSLSVAIRKVTLNRDGGAHAISDVSANLGNVELRYSWNFAIGRLIAGVGYDDQTAGASFGTDVRGFLNWQQGF
jgi:hypothetical protein